MAAQARFKPASRSGIKGNKVKQAARYAEFILKAAPCTLRSLCKIRANRSGIEWLFALHQDADSTDIYQISRNWADLVKRARSKQLAPDEYNSGNFTISNLGMFGADTFDAILPPGNFGCDDMQLGLQPRLTRCKSCKSVSKGLPAFSAPLTFDTECLKVDMIRCKQIAEGLLISKGGTVGAVVFCSLGPP